MRAWLTGLLLLLGGVAVADESVPVCYGYGCLVQVEIRYDEARLQEVGRLLASASDAAGERAALAEAMGLLYGWAGEQSDIRNDRGGNYADDGVSGKMDCIDHSTSTTRLLKMLAARHYLRWHRVLEPDARYFAFFYPAHFSAVIEEAGDAARFVVDSWFVDNGKPAVILPLDEWKRGAGPDV